MKTKLISKKKIPYYYNDELTEYEEFEYTCPCGKGKIVETHDETPGNREHYVWLLCEKCSKKYSLDTSRGVKNWDLVKITVDNWDGFLEKLNTENCFDKQLKEYLLAIKYVSEINVEKIDDVKIRDDINRNLNLIVEFIKNYGNDYYEIGLIKGFKINNKINSKQWLIDGRDYYYYIADQKIKASIYYVRYLNFINKYFSKNINAENELTKYISDIQNKLKNTIEISKDNIIGVIDDKLDNTEDYSKLRKSCINCIEQIRTNDINYLKYILFNNMMREIRYIGAAYQYLWHWEKGKKTIYRSGILDCKDNPYRNIKKKNNILKKMFQDCVEHMNSPSNCLHSYSENLLLDVYKYLILEKTSEKREEMLCNDEDIQIKNLIEENNGSIQFEILKDAMINCIFENGKAMSFQKFAMKENIIKMEDFSYIVEIFPQTLLGEKNEKGTTKHLRDLYFPEYFKSWGIEGKLSKTKVADDKEVITYGKCYEKKVNIDYDMPISFDACGTSILFCMTLDKKDILCLILKIGMKKFKNIEDIVSRLLDSHITWNDSNFSDGYQNISNCEVKCNCHMKDDVSVKTYAIIAVITKAYIEKLKTKDGNRLSLDKAKKQVKDKIIKELSIWCTNRYRGILQEKNHKVDFILSTIMENDYNFDLVNKYTEYMASQEDQEIAILKEIIFKE